MRALTATRDPAGVEERYFLATQWQLMGRRFRSHKLALIGAAVLVLLYVTTLLGEFSAPYDSFRRFADYPFAPPQRLRFIDQGRPSLRPFVYGYERFRDPESLRWRFTVDRSLRYPLSFFVHGDEYFVLGLFATDLHLFGVAGEEAHVFLFGTDKLGRDLFSRNIRAARISLTIGLVGVAISFLLGCTLGGISGYYGGAVDTLIQRVVEFLISIPSIPLWMALAASLPNDWPPIRVYFGITIILSVISWTGLARVVRSKLLELREADFVMAAKIAGAREAQIVRRHLLPSFLSYLIVSLTLSIPAMILGETALSFLGIGIQPPGPELGRAAAERPERAQRGPGAVAVHPRPVHRGHGTRLQLRRRRPARRRRPLYLSSAYAVAATIGLPLLARSIREFQLENDDHTIEIAGLVFNRSSTYADGPEGRSSIKEVREQARIEGGPGKTGRMLRCIRGHEEGQGDGDETTPIHSAVQSQGSDRSAARGPHDPGDRGQARSTSEPGQRLEAASAGGS